MKNILILFIVFCLTSAAAFSQQKTPASAKQSTNGSPVSATPDAAQNLPVDYTFTGDGAWSNASNWNNNLVPPPTTNPGSTISIYPNPQIQGSECVLDIPYTVTPMTSFTVLSGGSLVVSSLVVQ